MAKQKAPPIEMPSIESADTGNIELKGPAAELYREVHQRWELDAVADRLLRLACENIQSANACARIVEQAGLTVTEPSGRIVKHPAAIMMKDFQSNAAQTLQKLSLSLG